MTYLIVVGTEPAYVAVYETDSHDEMVLLHDLGIVYEKPNNWDSLTDKFWIAYARARGGLGTEQAKADLLSRVAKRID